MGIYIFNKDKLQKYLCADEADETSSNDFGKNIIPNMLAAGEKMVAYPFEGYWKDVGTISSLWEANMDLIGEPVLDLADPDWRIFSKNQSGGPQFVADGAKIENCYITDGCEIYGTVINSVLGSGVKVGRGAIVRDSVLMGDTDIAPGASINYSIVDTCVTIGAGAVVGAPRDEAKGITVLGEDVCVKSGAKIEAGEIVSES
jgi:glucose-1-phosphate adenylyltransferase